MNLISFFVLMGLSIFLIFWLFKKKMNKYKNFSVVRKTKEDKIIVNSMTVIIPYVTLRTLEKYGWTIAVWGSVAVFIIARIILAIAERKRD